MFLDQQGNSQKCMIKYLKFRKYTCSAHWKYIFTLKTVFPNSPRVFPLSPSLTEVEVWLLLKSDNIQPWLSWKEECREELVVLENRMRSFMLSERFFKIMAECLDEFYNLLLKRLLLEWDLVRHYSRGRQQTRYRQRLKKTKQTFYFSG